MQAHFLAQVRVFNPSLPPPLPAHTSVCYSSTPLDWTTAPVPPHTDPIPRKHLEELREEVIQQTHFQTQTNAQPSSDYTFTSVPKDRMGSNVQSAGIPPVSSPPFTITSHETHFLFQDNRQPGSPLALEKSNRQPGSWVDPR